MGIIAETLEMTLPSNATDHKRALNLEDIGAKAGVSRSTVSRVINNDPNVSETTRVRVLRVIEDMGYVPNMAARALVTRRTQVIGVVIPQRLTTIFNEPYYFPALLHGIANVFNARDYSMMLWVEEDHHDPQRFYDRIVRNRLIDGLIVASISQKSPFVNKMVEVDMPLVLTERPPQPLSHHSYVTIDNVAAAHRAVTHLIRLGRRKIAHITGDMTNPDALERLEGYRQALRDSGLPADPSLIVEGNFSRQSGYHGTKILLPRGIDAVFASNDQAALGVLDALQESTRRVPDDVAVVGFDDLPAAATSTPPLTSVRQPVQDRGARAAQLLLDYVEGVEKDVRQVLLPTELVIRESCGAHLSFGTSRGRITASVPAGE
jgi:LacI family transcriptional regulator